MRTTLLLLLALTGCSTIGYDRLPGPAGAEPVPAEAPRAILVVVDGLRADVLEDYLRTLRENDQEPAWPSGLALLAGDGFRLAQAARAEVALPGFGLAADATLITGQYPDATGIPGSVFYEAGPDGALRRFDFLAPPDAARIYFEPGFGLPDATHRPLLETLLRAPTLYERLGGSAVAVLHQLGRGAEWLIPDRSGDGINAILQHEYSAWTVPLFDRGVRNAAIDVLLGAPPPRLLTLYFRGVSSGSCFQALRTCTAEPPDLATIQADHLKIVDGHLARVLKVLQGAQPDIFRRTTIILAGTGGLTARDQPGARDASRLLAPADVFTRLAAVSEGACATWLKSAASHTEVVLAPNGAVGQLYVRQGPPGQRGALPEHLDCLGSALQRVLANADRKADAWLGGAAWMPAAGLGDPRPRGARVEVGLATHLASQLSASRRTRLLARLRRGFDDGDHRRTGDAILYAAAPWTFTDPLATRPPAHAGAGGLEDAALQTAFLVASADLTDQAVQGLTTASIELADVTPTLLSILQAPEEGQAGLPGRRS
ncbi:MAG: hypothetical protein R3F43_11580 [bacterium]